MAENLEYFRHQMLKNYQEYLLLADFTDNDTLLLIVKPFLELDEVMAAICDDIMDNINFRQHLDIHLCSFGRNDRIEIAIN